MEASKTDLNCQDVRSPGLWSRIDLIIYLIYRIDGSATQHPKGEGEAGEEHPNPVEAGDDRHVVAV